MLILAIDSAGAGCSVGLWQDAALLSFQHEEMERGQDRRLIPLVEQVIRDAGKTYADLDRIAVTSGPGSFTGLRIGLAAARGLGLALGKPVVGIDRFSLYQKLAACDGGQKSCFVILESRRAELYVRYMNGQGEQEEASMLTEPQIAEAMIRHPDALVVGDTRYAAICFSVEQMLAALAQTAANAGLSDPATLPRPLYIRPPDVTVKPSAEQVRLISLHDAEELAALHALGFPHAAWSLDQMRGSLALPTTRGWAVRHAGQVAAFLLCQIVGNEWEILTIATHPALQRRGFARLLMTQLAAAFGGEHGQKCFLEVAADNHAAQKLYEDAGFLQFGRRRDYYTSSAGKVDALLYETNFGNENKN